MKIHTRTYLYMYTFMHVILLNAFYIIALDLVFAEGIQSQADAEFITIPLLDGGCEMSVNSENKVHVHVRILFLRFTA